MADQLTTAQLEAIQRLISQPLREAVRAEMQAGHQKLTSAIEKVADQLAAHIAQASPQDRTRDARIESLEHRVGALERFRARVLLVYGALTIVLSLLWSLVRDWVAAVIRKR